VHASDDAFSDPLRRRASAAAGKALAALSCVAIIAGGVDPGTVRRLGTAPNCALSAAAALRADIRAMCFHLSESLWNVEVQIRICFN
jgi:hypothetical protein